MPMFKVELERRIFGYGEGNRNPFLGGMPTPGKTVDMSIRSWEFEAKDEAEVRALLAEAKSKDLGNVRGYHLRSIVQLPDSAGAKP